jgi:hypothetical protein
MQEPLPCTFITIHYNSLLTNCLVVRVYITLNTYRFYKILKLGQARIKSQASLLEICGIESGIGTGFFSQCFIFRLYHSIDASYAIAHLSLTLYNFSNLQHH